MKLGKDALQCNVDTPIGSIMITEEKNAIVAIDCGKAQIVAYTPLLQEVKEQLSSYFRGKMRTFNLPLAPMGTVFQRYVWSVICDIPFGGTCSYGILAAKMNTAARPIGKVCACNPIPILIPCHRILAANNKLGGYSSFFGIKTKKYLLDLESAYLHSMPYINTSLSQATI